MVKTALHLKKAGWPHEELNSYRPWQAMERYLSDPDLTGRRKRAWDVALKAAVMLKDRFRANRVLLFGSLAHGLWYTPRSDIDLCIDGIPAENFLRAEAGVEAIASGFKVDIVDSRECSAELIAQIDLEGIEL